MAQGGGSPGTTQTNPSTGNSYGNQQNTSLPQMQSPFSGGYGGQQGFSGQGMGGGFGGYGGYGGYGGQRMNEGFGGYGGQQGFGGGYNGMGDMFHMMQDPTIQQKFQQFLQQDNIQPQAPTTNMQPNSQNIFGMTSPFQNPQP